MPYEIVMSGPYGIEQLDCELTGEDRLSGYIREQVAQHRMTTEYPVWSRFQKPTRYYVKPAAGMRWFEPTPELKRVVRDAGGKNVRTAHMNGWSNQPSVITFSGYSGEERAVRDALEAAGFMVQVFEKDWR